MRIYVIRHGESETNLSKKWTGWLDVHLTEKGREDARKAGSFLNHLCFDKIYSSDLFRAKETAETAIPDCCYETSELLREINVGTLTNHPVSVLTDEQRADAFRFGYENYYGESKEQFRNRIRRFIGNLEELPYENVALFSHAGWLRGMLDMVLGVELPRDRICCNNGTIAVFEYTSGNWRLHSWMNLT